MFLFNRTMFYNRKNHTPLSAIIGDIHGNLEALTAVLKDLRKRKVSEVICTGDIVGYGADPSKCIQAIQNLNASVVLGNHDLYAVSDMDLSSFNESARATIQKTRNQLTVSEQEWLQNLPLQLAVDIPSSLTLKCSVVHSTMQVPEAWDYLLREDHAHDALKAQQEDIVFFGHTHVPALFSLNQETEEFIANYPLKEGKVQLNKGWRYLINPGSVGQPRDRDSRAAYALFDPENLTLELRRVKYNIRKAQKKILAAGLPEHNANRLSLGK